MIYIFCVVFPTISVGVGVLVLFATYRFIKHVLRQDDDGVHH